MSGLISDWAKTGVSDQEKHHELRLRVNQTEQWISEDPLQDAMI